MKPLFKLIIVAIFSSLLITACGGSSDPKDIIRDFYSKAEANDVEGVLDMMSTETKALVQKEKLEKGLAEKSEEIKEKGGISSIEFTDEKVKEESIDYKVKLTYGDGSTSTDKAKLVKEDGEWKIGAAKN
ncbi:MAG: DUF4878 domain-containing protein [Melioribacteraceae bacterium]|nr:DUF4878 domain-containing protein [Melioribacteraceae bacterium]MCF8355062.1 DUF4878 domain-containing protein [Melioribacteraceae bacterium]MCF8395641.1 DUF4878 domain-containing protein [Melioribacteraceae bacterium]MCF8420280.1 DUF4878 domain-containing protein [Melioribacteraceae bacterium]